MSTIQELNSQYKAMLTEAETLLGAGKHQDAAAKLGEADMVKAQIDIAKRVEEGKNFLSEPAGTQAAHVGTFRPAAPDEGNLEVDGKSWRSFEIAFPTPWGMEKKEYRYDVPLAVTKKGYKSAFEAYIRKGQYELGPNDRKALTEGTDSAGGYTVPEEVIAGILKKTATMATVRRFARVIQISRDVARLTRIKYTTNNEYTSGIRFTWTGETPSAATAHRVTDQVFGSIAVPVHTCMASQLISNDLIEDSAYDVLGISADLMGEAFALGENDCFWSGTGAGQPRGIITDCSDTTNWDAALTDSTAATTFSAADLVDCIYALPAQYERNARIFMTKATEKFIRQLTDTDGNFLWPVWNQVGNLGDVPGTILGFPYVRDEFMDEIATDNGGSATTYEFPVVFGDLSAYAVIDRVGMSIQRNDSLYSETNNVLLLGRKRVGGQLLEAYKLSLLRTASS